MAAEFHGRINRQGANVLKGVLAQPTRRLGSDPNFVRPEVTLQDQLSADDIRKKLEKYVRVDDIKFVRTGSHLRYFAPDRNTGQRKFRVGGFLKRKEPEYVVLSNGNHSWTVTIDTAEFWRRMTPDEETEANNEEINIRDQLLQEQDEEIKRLRRQLRREGKRPVRP